MKMMLRLTNMFFLFISFLAGMLVCIEAYQMKDHLMELAIQRVEKFVKTVVIECVPQYDYQEYENTEILYQWTKKAVYGMFLPLWEYQEQYGGSREQLLSENAVPSFLFSEDDETEKDKEEETQSQRTFTTKQLYSQSYLRKYFIQVDSTTTITNQ